MIIALALACAPPDNGPPTEPDARKTWLLHHDIAPEHRAEVLDILRGDPDPAIRAQAWYHLIDAQEGKPYFEAAADPDALNAVLDSWVTYREDAGSAWVNYANIKLGCARAWGCVDDGEARRCHVDAPPACHAYDHVRTGCLRDQGPCIQSGNSVPDAGPGSPRMRNNAPATADTEQDAAIYLAGQAMKNPPPRSP